MIREYIASFKDPFISDYDKCENKGSQETFVMLVGYTFNSNIKNAMYTARMGYCHGFADIGISYVVIDIKKSIAELEKIKNPIIFIFAHDLLSVSLDIIKNLKKYKLAIWVPPLFDNQNSFFLKHDFDPKVWSISKSIINKIIEMSPSFLFTATCSSGLSFFSSWEKMGFRVVSLPLACDTRIYNINNLDYTRIENKLTFVGSYWKSKGVQIDAYLKQYEDMLFVYGQSKWPYKNYGGIIDFPTEAKLYNTSIISPVINEPSVNLLNGQINERVFKVLGCSGFPVVDNVIAYKELFDGDVLYIPNSVKEFHEHLIYSLNNLDYNLKVRNLGYNIVMQKHTYSIRANMFLSYLK
jgi:hypothetical protein